ncbi:hypothetical protein CGZ94_04985 [Enemella evansiae]|uniref:Uncharacterized protein n=2 Tax=Enemella evansiae TaxID=2016499 RepID=A0A255GKC6_9ACTN|nr:hypothetical protein CGZ94_04985 [Enemella evansiae]
MGAEREAPVMTCSRCGSAWLTERGAGLLLLVIQEERDLCDLDDATDSERYAALGVLDDLIAGCAVAMIRPGSRSGDSCVKEWPDSGHEDEGYSCSTHNMPWGECLPQSGDPSS